MPIDGIHYDKGMNLLNKSTIDNLGKELISLFETNLATESQWWTDSMGQVNELIFYTIMSMKKGNIIY